LIAVCVCGQSETYEKHYSAIASDIYDQKVTLVPELQKRLKAIAPTDEEFVLAFANLSLTQAKIARYYFRELEKTANPSYEGWDPTNDETAVNLEHVLPKRKGSEWTSFDEESHKTYRNRLGNRLGNQCLLDASTNSALGNSLYSEKHAALLQSTFVTTRWAAEADEWSGEVIKVRQKRLASFASETWPL
jgi:hypothetical protein